MVVLCKTFALAVNLEVSALLIQRLCAINHATRYRKAYACTNLVAVLGITSLHSFQLLHNQVVINEMKDRSARLWEALPHHDRSARRNYGIW